MSPFDDFDLDLLKIQNTGGVNPLDDDTGGGSGNSSVFPSFTPEIGEAVTTMFKTLGKC